MNMLTKLACMLLLTLSLGASAFAATEAELQGRFKERYPQLQSLKQQGKIGETASGFVEAVKPEFAGEVSAVANAENADRNELYALLAKRTSTTPEVVATRNATRNFQKAGKGEWLKHADTMWRQK